MIYKPLAFLIGATGIGIAVASRSVLATDITNIIGPGEMKATIEHFLGSLSVPFLFHTIERRVEDRAVEALGGMYMSYNIVWEIYQWSERGYFQCNQALAEIVGFGLALGIIRYKELQTYLQQK